MFRLKKSPCNSSFVIGLLRYISAAIIFISLPAPFPCKKLNAGIIWPIDRPKFITGTFCEPRGGRFHAGIDVSCAGLKGFKVFAADSGYVSTVMYQKWGIGYAVFVTHPDGRKSFYGHLDRFADVLLDNPKVKSAAGDILERRDFHIELKESELPVRQGALIGFSGDSGIGREHFHFELRDGDNGNLNPLRHGLSVPDAAAPVFTEVYLVPLDEYSIVDGKPEEKAFRVRQADKQKNIYGINGKDIPEIGGRIGVKVKAYDTIGYSRKVALYGLDISVNGEKKYSCEFDQFPRDQSHRMGLYYDYNNSNNSIYTYYVYSRQGRGGVIDTGVTGSQINVEIIACDAAMNRSYLSFPVRGGKPSNKPLYVYTPNLLPGKALKISSADRMCTVRFKKESAFYGEMIGMETASLESPVMAGLPVKSARYTVSPGNLCIDVPATVSIRYEGEDYRKVGIYFMNPRKKVFSFAGNVYNKKDGNFTADILRMGSFFLLRDDISPRVRYKPVRKVKPGYAFKFHVSDIGTGIDLCNVKLEVDGKNVSWDFDPDYGYIEILPHNDIWQKGNHVITLCIQDMAGNKSGMILCPYTI